MSGSPRFVVGAASVCAFVLAVGLALTLGPSAFRAWLLFPAAIGIALSVSSVVAEPRELFAALAFSATPAMRLAAPSGPHWLIGPVAVLLLVGCELNAWSWELAGHDTVGRDHRRRLASVLRLALIGLVAALGTSLVARSTLLSGLAAATAASAALAGLGRVVLPRRRAARIHPVEALRSD